MKSTTLRYGAYSSATILVLFTISNLLMGTLSYQLQEVFGYASIALAASFVFFGIKYYRDEVNNDKLSFVEGLKLGLLIILLPSVVFGIFNVVYIEIINPEFMDSYYTDYADRLRSTLPAEEFKIELAKIESEKEMFENPFAQFFFMGIMVFIFGVIGTVASTLILQKK